MRSDAPQVIGKQRVLLGAGAGYDLLFGELQRQIRSGAWAPNNQIPSERELSKTYGVSRTTVRTALLKAEQHGLIMRIPGSGTYVRQPRIQQPLAHMDTFRASLRQHGLTPRRRTLHIDWRPATPELSRELRVPQLAQLLFAETLGLADEEPCALYQTYIAQPAAASVERRLREPGGDDRATYEHAAAALGLDHLDADQTFEAVLVDPSGTEFLNAPIGAPAFRVKSVFRTPDGVPVESRVALYRGDYYSFQIGRRLDLGAPP